MSDILTANAIKVRNLFLKPSADFADILSQSIRILTLESEEYPEYLGRSGSATLLEHSNKYYVACTRHQIGQRNNSPPEQKIIESIRVPTRNRPQLTNIPLSKCIFENSQFDEEYNDCLLFEVDLNWTGIKTEVLQFYPLSGQTSNISRRCSWAIGCSQEMSTSEYEPNRLNAVTFAICCNYDSNFNTNAQFVTHFTYKGEPANLDGLSGGAVFSLIGDLRNYEIVFDGLITRAGNGNIYCVSAEYFSIMIS